MPRSIDYPIPVRHILLPAAGKLAYMDLGKGSRTILFVHGLTSYGPSWTKNIEELSAHYRCIAIDLPGSGLSDPAPASYTLGFFASCIEELISQLKLKRVVLAGHSMGAQIVLKAILQNPALAEGLILCAPAGFETFSEADKMILRQGLSYAGWFTTDEDQVRHSVASSFYKSSVEMKAMSNQLVALMKQGKRYKNMVEQCINAMLDEPVFHRLHEIELPALVLFGQEDALIPNKLLHQSDTKQIAKAGADKMKQARLFIIRDAGHFVQWEQAAVVNKLIREFLN